MIKVFKHLDGHKLDRDLCALVCQRWYQLERASRHTIRIGASDGSDECIGLLVRCFTDLRCVYMDERLAVSAQLPSSFHLGFRLVGNLTCNFMKVTLDEHPFCISFSICLVNAFTWQLGLCLYSQMHVDLLYICILICLKYIFICILHMFVKCSHLIFLFILFTSRMISILQLLRARRLNSYYCLLFWLYLLFNIIFSSNLQSSG